MTQESTNPTSHASILEKGAGLLERAWEAHWALKLVCIVLFFDMAMLLHVQRGLSQWSEVGKGIIQDVGWLAVTFVAFSFIVAIVLPALLIVFRYLSASIVYKLEDLFQKLLPTPADSGPYRRPLGNVPAYALHDLALEEKDNFLFHLYETHEKNRKTARMMRERTGELTASVVLAVFVDWLVDQWVPGGISLIGALDIALAEYFFPAAMAVLFCVGIILKRAWFSPYIPDEIYYPPLDRKLR